MSLLLVFDIDGTLTDTVAIHRAAFHEVLLGYGFAGLNPNGTGYKHHTDSNIFKEIYSSQNADWNESILKEFEKELTANIRGRIEKGIVEIDGAKEFLNELSEKNIAYCYATGSFQEPAFLKLKNTSLPLEPPLSNASFHYDRESIVGFAIEESRKFYKREFSKIISLGDGVWDFNTAKNLNLEFIGIAKNSEIRESLESVGVSQIYSNYGSLKPVLYDLLQTYL